MTYIKLIVVQTRGNLFIKKDDEIDYFKELDKALKASQKALRQLTDVIDEAGVAGSDSESRTFS